jgi:hypothetical protein
MRDGGFAFRRLLEDELRVDIGDLRTLRERRRRLWGQLRRWRGRLSRLSRSRLGRLRRRLRRLGLFRRGLSENGGSAQRQDGQRKRRGNCGTSHYSKSFHLVGSP